jgi:orc1/cdc6 family replication initiation protein
MIADARALRTKFVPQELQHREAAIEQLSRALRPIVHGAAGENALVTGPSGTGKTTTAKYVARQLEKETFGFRWGYVNCLSRSTRSQILWKLARDAGVGSDLRPEGHAPVRFLDRIDGLDEHFVAIVDECNALREPDTLLGLCELSNISLILICVSEDDFFADVDARVLDRLRGAVKIHLEKYTDSQLCDILEKRVEHGLATSAVAPDVIEAIADIAAGDARHGIILLRKAVRHAIEQDDSQVQLSHIRAVEDDVQEAIHERYISDFGTEMRLLLEIVREEGPLSAPALKAQYESRSDDPVADSTRRKYLSSLERYELIEQSGTGKGTTYDTIAEKSPDTARP